jgi:hypothetical protein
VHAHDVITACGGALANGPVVLDRRRGFAGEHRGGLQGGVGQDLMDRGLPVCSSDGEAATDDGAEKFIGVGWPPATSGVLKELL